MKLSREMRRNIQSSGLRKKFESNFYKTIGEINSTINDLSDFKLKNGGKYYDFTSIVIFCLSVIGARNMDKGFDLVHTHMHEIISERDYADDNVKIYLVGSNLNNILSKYEEAGLKGDIERVVALGRILGVYNGNIGDCLLDDYFSDDSNDIYSIVPEPERLKDMQLSTIYGVALDTYSLCMLDSCNITEEFIMLYMLMLTLSNESVTYKFLSICLGYCIKQNLKEGKKCDLLMDLGDNIVDDVSKLGDKYIGILNILECNDSGQGYVSSCEGLKDEELRALEHFRLSRISATLDYMYKWFIVDISNKLKDSKSEVVKKEKELLKDIRSLNKKVTKLESNLKSKTKEVDKLSKELRLSKKNTVNTDNIRLISELEAKLKSVESKNVALTNRISTLECKLKEATDVKSKVLKDKEDIVHNLEEVSEEASISMEEKLASITDTRLLVVGGNVHWFNKIKGYIPNATHINVNQKGSNYSVPLATECVLVVSNMVKHSHVFRLETQLRKGVPVVPTPTYRLSDIVDSLYRELIIKCKNKVS